MSKPEERNQNTPTAPVRAGTSATSRPYAILTLARAIPNARHRMLQL